MMNSSFSFNYNLQPNQMPVKVFFNNGEVRRFKIDYPTYLQKLVGVAISQLQDKSVDTRKFNISYEDVDGDWVNLDTEEEFAECFSHSYGPALKIKIECNFKKGLTLLVPQFEKKEETPIVSQPQIIEEINTQPHKGVNCDKCGQKNFTGKRYKCLHCPDYDLCDNCFPGRSKFHSLGHPFKMVKRNFNLKPKDCKTS
jgi:hypothetical protein